MLIEALILPLLFGKLLGGKFKNLLEISVRFWWLIPISGFVEFGASIIRAKEVSPIWQFIDQNVIWIQLFTYSLLIIVLGFNLKEKGFIWILMGLLMNLTVIMFNQGRMPVDIQSIMNSVSQESIEYLKSGKDLIHVIATDQTRLRFLGDIIHIMKPYPLPKSISIGDIFLVLGVFRFIFDKMKQKT